MTQAEQDAALVEEMIGGIPFCVYGKRCDELNLKL